MDSTQLALDFSNFTTPLARLKKTVPIDTTFPEEEANRLATIESFNKHLFRPNTYLHKWWARRSGTTFRYILKQLVPDISKRDYYSPGGLEGVTILDPMIGGGTTLHEAIRLGANVIGYDIDPIPVLQAKASLAGISISDQCWIGKNIHFPTNNFEIPNGPKSDDLKNRNIHYFYQLFSPVS